MLEAYAVCQSLIRALAQLVRVIKKFDRDLGDQLQRAGSSTLLNVGEGQRRSGGDRGRFFGYASGSAGEVMAVLDAARAWGWPLDDREARAHADRLLGLLYGLIHGPKRLRR